MKKVCVFFGGRSAEHEVSVISAKSVIQHLDKNKYEIIPVGITKKGMFCFDIPAIREHMPEAFASLEDLYDDHILSDRKVTLRNLLELADVVFPVFHGPYGEDGGIQGLFKSLDIPYVGSDVLGSAIAMDKDVTKRLLREAGIPCVKSMTFWRGDKIDYNEVKKELGNIVFVKPVNLGSSVGISKAKSESEFLAAIERAFLYDKKVLVEKAINAREIESAALENPDGSVFVSVLGEIIVKSEFYSYEAKYIDEDSAELQVPARISRELSDRIRGIAAKAFRVLCLSSMARIDFLVDKDTNEIYLNEPNTIPGFTSISMYPKMCEASGISYSELLDRLIDLAIARHAREKLLKIDH